MRQWWTRHTGGRLTCSTSLVGRSKQSRPRDGATESHGSTSRSTRRSAAAHGAPSRLPIGRLKLNFPKSVPSSDVRVTPFSPYRRPSCEYSTGRGRAAQRTKKSAISKRPTSSIAVQSLRSSSSRALKRLLDFAPNLLDTRFHRGHPPKDNRCSTPRLSSGSDGPGLPFLFYSLEIPGALRDPRYACRAPPPIDATLRRIDR